ncbi:MAG TPA: hypothetical protein VHE37_07490 [Nevskiaceae bacterium]|nr:hypothetical protein [Nevskiaceae bacterium]
MSKNAQVVLNNAADQINTVMKGLKAWWQGTDSGYVNNGVQDMPTLPNLIQQIMSSALNPTGGVDTRTPLTGFTVAMQDLLSSLQLTPAGTLASGTVQLPNNPLPGQLAEISTTKTISALTVVAQNVGHTVHGGAAAPLVADTAISFRFNADQQAWARVISGVRIKTDTFSTGGGGPYPLTYPPVPGVALMLLDGYAQPANPFTVTGSSLALVGLDTSRFDTVTFIYTY